MSRGATKQRKDSADTTKRELASISELGERPNISTSLDLSTKSDEFGTNMCLVVGIGEVAPPTRNLLVELTIEEEDSETKDLSF